MTRSGPGERRFARVVSVLAGVLVLLVPSAQALAVDDPGPAQWPTIQPPDGGGNGSDPAVVKWPSVAQPESDSSADDPKPVNWPGPESN